MCHLFVRAVRRTAFVVAVAIFAAQGLTPARAGVMLQGFYTDVPSPAAGGGAVPWWWDRMGGQANSLRLAGFTAVWVPPVLKGAAGGYSNGYDPFDDYDIGSKNQKGTTTTRYGTREQLEKMVAQMRANGLDVYLDMVENHRNGDDGNFSFRTNDAYGVFGAGRFQKGFYDFHPNVPQDPNVPDDAFSFGRDCAPVNGAGGYCGSGLNAAGDWLTKALDIQGYRLDYVKGISTDWLRPFLNYGAMAGKFAVGEYYDSDITKIQSWIGTGMQNRASAFDFPLRDKLKAMCDGGGFFDMSTLDHAGLVGVNPGGAVTFVENHDTDGSGPITQNKALGYAYILTSEGYPCVFYRDYSTDPGCYGLKTVIDNLIFVHEKLASGATQQRWKDGDVFAYERLGGSHLLVGLNDNGASARTVTVQTGFGANVQLHDYTGHAGDVYTDGAGQTTITIPKDTNGAGYVCYSRTGLGGGFTATGTSVSQEYAGASDLDIKPADATLNQVCRVWAVAGKPVVGALYFDAASWTTATRIYLEVKNPTGSSLISRSYYSTTAQGATITMNATQNGWYTFRIRAYNPPAANPKPTFWLKATYTAPQI